MRHHKKWIQTEGIVECGAILETKTKSTKKFENVRAGGASGD